MKRKLALVLGVFATLVVIALVASLTRKTAAAAGGVDEPILALDDGGRARADDVVQRTNDHAN